MNSIYRKATSQGSQRTFYASFFKLGLLFFLLLELQATARSSLNSNSPLFEATLEVTYTPCQVQQDQQVSGLSSNARIVLVPSPCWLANFPNGSLQVELHNDYQGFTLFVGEEALTSCSEVARIEVTDTSCGVERTYLVKLTAEGGILIVDLED